MELHHLNFSRDINFQYTVWLLTHFIHSSWCLMYTMRRPFWHTLYLDSSLIISNREFKLRIIRQTSNGRQRKILRYPAIKSKLTCCFKTEIHNYSFDTRKKIWNENVQRIFCQENTNLPFAVPGNVKLKFPNNMTSRKLVIKFPEGEGGLWTFNH